MNGVAGKLLTYENLYLGIIQIKAYTCNTVLKVVGIINSTLTFPSCNIWPILSKLIHFTISIVYSILTIP